MNFLPFFAVVPNNKSEEIRWSKDQQRQGEVTDHEGKSEEPRVPAWLCKILIR
jgi:hypothetical protein